MDFRAFDFSDSSDPPKNGYGMEAFYSRHSLEQTDDSADFFSFADASTDFNFTSNPHPSSQSLPQSSQLAMRHQPHASSQQQEPHLNPHSQHSHAYQHPMLTTTQHVPQQQHHNVPQLTPDGRDGSHTSSSVLSGHNPEYTAMSPLQISTMSTMPTVYYASNHPVPLSTHVPTERGEEEECFTPLISPAIHSSNINGLPGEESNFSPLTSPALHPAPPSIGANMDQSAALQRELAMIEQRQQQLLQQHLQSPYLGAHVPNPQQSPRSRPNDRDRKQSLRKKIAMSSPQFHPTPSGKDTPTTFSQRPLGTIPNLSPSAELSGFIAPATPASLMKLGGSGGGDVLGESGSTPPPGGANIVDNMPSLPAAILDDGQASSHPPPPATTKTPKRRRLSQQPRGQPYQPPFAPSPVTHMNDNVAALVSPLALRPQQSPRALKPLISPSLQPNGKRMSAMEADTAAAILASKSNYQTLREGKAKSLGIDFAPGIHSGIENRRSAHKAAEQKRRDTLKQSFDSLRKEVVEAVIEEHGGVMSTEKEKELKQMSKVVLLQHSYEYILRLKSDGRRKDDKLDKMRTELQSLRVRLGLPEQTDEEKEEEAREKEEEQIRRQARLKRLEAVAVEEQEQQS